MNRVYSADGSLTSSEIPEDSICSKLLSCLPVIGYLVKVVNEAALLNKIQGDGRGLQGRIECIKIKNHYKLTSIVREVLSVAALSHFVAASIFFYLAIVFVALIANHIYNFSKNHNLIVLLSQNKTPGIFHVR